MRPGERLVRVRDRRDCLLVLPMDQKIRFSQESWEKKCDLPEVDSPILQSEISWGNAVVLGGLGRAFRMRHD